MALGRKISQLQSVNTAGSNDDIPIVQNGVTKKTSVEKINQEQELATVAYSNDYNDLDNTPNLAPVATSNDYNDLENTPNLAPVATSNNYNDLDNLPEIPVQITPTIQQVLEQGDTSTIPFTVSGTNSKAVHSSKGYDVQETDGTTVLTTEVVSKQVRHVKKVNGTEAGRTELEYEEPTIQAKITVPNKTGTMALLSDINGGIGSVNNKLTHIENIVINNGSWLGTIDEYWGEVINTPTWDTNNLYAITYNLQSIRGRITPFNNCVLKKASVILRTSPSSGNSNVTLKVFKRDFVNNLSVEMFPNELVLLEDTKPVTGAADAMTLIDFTPNNHVPIGENSIYYVWIKKDNVGSYQHINIKLTFEQNEN